MAAQAVEAAEAAPDGATRAARRGVLMAEIECKTVSRQRLPRSKLTRVHGLLVVTSTIDPTVITLGATIDTERLAVRAMRDGMLRGWLIHQLRRALR
jgi:hypothetical protein